jgi:mono/diheme cytochrome c family protein
MMRNFMEKQNFQLAGRKINRKINKGLNYCAALFIALLILAIGNTVCYSSETDQHEGAQYFKQVCVACHTINGGTLVGPDLANVHDRRSDVWLQKFIKSSQALINSGDPDAVAVFEQFNKIIMPDPPFTDKQITAIIGYIKAASGGEAQSAGAGAVGGKTAASVDTAIGSTEDVIMGQNLFQGKVRLKNGGPTCISCHDVKNDAVIGGGILARELTTVFSRMGEPGVRAILGSAPFPVMQQAYVNKPLTDEEIFSIVSFLEQADKDHMFQQPRDYGVKLAGTGVVGLIVLLGGYSLLWHKRKKKLVNQDTFDRQVKSE